MQAFFRHYVALRKEIDAWLAQSRRMDPPGRHGGGEDEANYALAWFPHFLATGGQAVVEHFQYLRDQLAGWVRRECLHGYEPEAEAHHGTEPFLLFLPRYLGLFPEDRLAARLLGDAAEHIGNWEKGIPAWFDWDRNRFFGYHIGTRSKLGYRSSNRMLRSVVARCQGATWRGDTSGGIPPSGRRVRFAGGGGFSGRPTRPIPGKRPDLQRR